MAWNRTTTKPAVQPRKKRTGLFLTALLIALVGLGVGVFLLMDAEQSVEQPRKKRAVIQTKTNLVARVKVEEESVEPVRTNMELRRWPKSRTNELSRGELAYWKLYNPIVPPSKFQPELHRPKYQIFGNRIDNQIASVVGMEPGTMVLAHRRVSPDFAQRFLESLKHPIIPTESDDDYSRELKRAVNEAKIELKARYDAGEDICKIMNDAMDEMQRLGQYRAQIERDAANMLSSSASVEDIDVTISAVNQMLEKKGIAPIELNSMSRLALKRQLAEKKENVK